jgi:alpha-N-arabinofuranosidase
MGMTPVLTVWDGKSYDEILSGDDLHPFLDDILDELEVHHTLPILSNSLTKL